MTPRDAALLPRLLYSLDTLENDGEIVQAVRQVRRILASDRISLMQLVRGGSVRSTVSLADDRREVQTKIRDLGLMLRRANHDDPTMAVVFDRVRDAMIVGGEVEPADLRVVVVGLRDLLKQLMQESHRNMRTEQENLRNAHADMQAERYRRAMDLGDIEAVMAGINAMMWGR